MPTAQPPPTGTLREMMTGMLTLLEWQEQLVRGALAKLDDNTTGDGPAKPSPEPQ